MTHICIHIGQYIHHLLVDFVDFFVACLSVVEMFFESIFLDI
jgi:hypothetical protein